jgi:hypothetical protein
MLRPLWQPLEFCLQVPLLSTLPPSITWDAYIESMPAEDCWRYTYRHMQMKQMLHQVHAFLAPDIYENKKPEATSPWAIDFCGGSRLPLVPVEVGRVHLFS